jgi:DNA (cytosine-5)-methyltransferase 1
MNLNFKMIHIDLFSGIGGFSFGLEDMEVDKTYFSEIDKHAIANYKYNFKNTEYAGPIENVSGSELRAKHQGAKFIVTGGWPCQDNSIAGKRKGQRDGTRSGLFNEVIRVIREVQPEYFILENVKGLYSVNNGKDFRDSLERLSYLDTNDFQYCVEHQLCNTLWLLPQNRERAYFIGYPSKGGFRGILPITETDFGINEGKPETAIVRTITAGGHSGGHHSGMTLVRWQNKKDGIVIDENCPTLRASGGTDIRKMPNIIQKGRGFNKGGIKDNCPTISVNSFEQNNHVIVKRQPLKFINRNQKNIEGDYSFTIDSVNTGGVNIDGDIRRLTENEVEMLQGFPVDFTKFGIYNGETKEIARSNRYKLCGNAVTTKIVKLIGQKIKNNGKH